MKKLVILGLVSIMLLPLLAVGCTSATQTTAPATQTIDITMDEFAAQQSQVINIDLAVQGTLTVKLGSNPTTGYNWEDVSITNTDVIEQLSRNYEAPTAGLMGAGGTEVWVFSALETGTTTISFNYSQSWDGGVKDAYTVTINVNVK